jgi:hypothetical protein
MNEYVNVIRHEHAVRLSHTVLWGSTLALVGWNFARLGSGTPLLALVLGSLGVLIGFTAPERRNHS